MTMPWTKTEAVRVYLNNTEEDIPLDAQSPFTDRYENGILKKNGMLICKKG